MVRGLVEGETVHSSSREQSNQRARPLAWRQRRGVTQDLICAETELREQRSSRLFARSACLGERRQQRPVRELDTLLSQLAEHDTRPAPECAFGEGQSFENRVEQRRLAASVRTDDRKPIGPGELEVERAEPERAPLDHRTLEPNDDVAAAGLRSQFEPQLPRLVRLVDRTEPFDAAADRLLHVLGLLLLSTLAVATLFPALHPPQLLLETGLLALVGVVGVRLAAQGMGARLLVFAPA